MLQKDEPTACLPQVENNQFKTGNKMEEIIEQYLLGQLSKEEKAAFEQRINTEPNLAKEVIIQRKLMEAIKLQGLKVDISNAWQKVRIGKMLKNGFIAVVVAAILGLGIYYVTKTLQKDHIDYTETGASLPTTLFEIDNTKDTVIETANGIILHIPANAFGDMTRYELEVKEALNALDILEAGLSTMADSNLLATAGMFKITATKDGVELQLADGKQITAQVPTDEVDPDMMLFDGQEDSTGNVNWVNPKKIKNYLVTRSFDELDFYPRGYLAKVAELGYDASDKQFTDSLYWSFDCGVRSEAAAEVIEDSTMPALNEEESQTNKTGITEPTWEIKINPSKFKIGDIVTIEIVSSNLIENKQWIYANAKESDCYHQASLNLGNSVGIKRVGPLKPFSFKDVFDPILNCTTYQFREKAIFKQEVKILEKDYSLEGQLKYEVCNSQGRCRYFAKLFSHKGLGNQLDTSIADKAEESRPEICPTSIKALQSQRFATTYIATKEFEQRLKHLFDVCDEASLNIYIQHLGKDISYADSIVASRISADKKEMFQRFAAQKLGNTKKASPAFAELAAYHSKKSKAYQEATTKARKKVLAKYAKQDANKRSKDLKKSSDEWQDRANVYQKELKTNLVEAYRQAGLDYNKISTKRNYYTVPIDTIGWKNLDVYVTESTNTRTSLKTTYNGKDISIEYHTLKVQVDKENDYDFVNVYLIPDNLPSYQKIKKKGIFHTESLNELFDYDLFCLAKKGSDYFYYTDLLQKKDDSKTVTLQSINKKELDNLLKSMNKKSTNRNVADDLEYEEQNLFYNQNLEKRKKDNAFRREVEGVIWPCSQTPEAPSAAPQDGYLYGVPPEDKKIVQSNNSINVIVPFPFQSDSTSNFAQQDEETLAITPTTFAKQTQLQNYLKSEYLGLYNELAEDFDLDDPTFHASFKVIYCNLKKTPFITASNAETTEHYEVDMSNTFIKSREFKKFFELCAADCSGTIAFQ